MSARNAWNEIIVQSIPTKRKEPSDDGDDDDDDVDDDDACWRLEFSYCTILFLEILTNRNLTLLRVCLVILFENTFVFTSNALFS